MKSIVKIEKVLWSKNQNIQPVFRKSIFILFLLSMSMLSACAQHTMNLKTEQIIQGIPCIGKITFNDNQSIHICFLSKETKILGYLIPGQSKLIFNKNGTLDQFILGKEAVILDQNFPANTRFFLNRWNENISFWLPEKRNIQGYEIASSNDGVGTPLFPNGKLKEIWLVKDQIIEGVPCSTGANVFKYGFHVISLGTERRVKLYDNGHLKQAMLSNDCVIQNHNFKQGEFIKLNENGSLKTD